jgi:hypothetical protein
MKSPRTRFNAFREKIAGSLPSSLLLIRLFRCGQISRTYQGKLANLERTAGFFSELGLPPPKPRATLAGLFTCVPPLPLAFTMAAAYLVARRDTVTGIVFNPAAVLVFVVGPGAIPADHLFNKQPQEAPWSRFRN